MKTFSPTPKDIKHDWYVVDAQDQVLGRLASQIAHRLRGKHKPEFAPHVDNGDFIIVINCEKIKVTGTKMTNKLYRRHSGHAMLKKLKVYAGPEHPHAAQNPQPLTLSL